MATSSRTFRSFTSVPTCSIPPTRPLRTASAGGRPNTEISPLSGRSKPSNISIVVVFPAPFGPRRAMVWPRAMEMSTPCTAFTAPNDFMSPEMEIHPWPSRSPTVPAKARLHPPSHDASP